MLHLLDELSEFFWPEPVLAGQRNQFAGFGDYLAAAGCDASDRNAATATELDEALVAQCPQRAEDGVGVDPEHCGQVLRRRQSLPRRCLAVRDRPADSSSDLFVQRNRAQVIDRKSTTSASYISIIIDSAGRRQVRPEECKPVSSRMRPDQLLTQQHTQIAQDQRANFRPHADAVASPDCQRWLILSNLDSMM